jgi:WS/DGAT/MGAT family acyltransferase
MTAGAPGLGRDLWSQSDRMNELETTMWRAERHPERSSTICSLITLDEAPDWDRLVAAHDWATRMVPRARHRVVEPLLPTGPPVWRRDPHFAMGYHLRRLHLGPRNTFGDLLSLAQTLAITPFDRTRPLWEATLIEGLEGGGAAYLLKLHHSLTDGLGAIQLLSLVQSRTREHTVDKPVAPEDDAEPDDDQIRATVQGAVRTLSQMPAVLGAGVDTGRHWLAHPGTASAEALRFGASLRRVLSPPPAPPSPLFQPRDGRVWVFQTLECPLADLRRSAKAAGGSVNDAYLAVLLGGLRRYHEQHGLELDEIPVTVPVSMRRDDDPMGGNKFAGAMFAAPIGIADPAERIAAMRGIILSQLTEPALDALSVVTPIVNRLPSAVGAAIVRMAANTDLSASNVPGLAEPVYMAGARVERVFPFGPLPGVAIMAAMVTHVGTCCIGLNIDGSVVHDVSTLMRCMGDGLEEVLTVGRTTRNPPSSRR